MAGIRERFERAIITADWEEVCNIFEFLYKDRPPTPSPIEVLNESSIRHDVVMEIINFIQSKYIGGEDIDNNDNMDSTRDTTGNTLSRRPSEGNIQNTLQAITFTTPEDDNPEYKKAIKKHAKISQQRQKRKPYQPNLQKCDACGNEFDFSVEYPAGKLTESKGSFCSKCDLKKYATTSK